MNQRKIQFGTLVWLLLLVGLGIMRSAIATRLDGFTVTGGASRLTRV